jgi:hypothetical protein
MWDFALVSKMKVWVQYTDRNWAASQGAGPMELPLSIAMERVSMGIARILNHPPDMNPSIDPSPLKELGAKVSEVVYSKEAQDQRLVLFIGETIPCEVDKIALEGGIILYKDFSFLPFADLLIFSISEMRMLTSQQQRQLRVYLFQKQIPYLFICESGLTQDYFTHYVFHAKGVYAEDIQTFLKISRHFPNVPVTLNEEQDPYVFLSAIWRVICLLKS